MLRCVYALFSYCLVSNNEECPMYRIQFMDLFFSDLNTHSHKHTHTHTHRIHCLPIICQIIRSLVQYLHTWFNVCVCVFIQHLSSCVCGLNSIIVLSLYSVSVSFSVSYCILQFCFLLIHTLYCSSILIWSFAFGRFNYYYHFYYLLLEWLYIYLFICFVWLAL